MGQASVFPLWLAVLGGLTLVGVCQVQQDTRLAWSLNAVTRIHHYPRAALDTSPPSADDAALQETA